MQESENTGNDLALSPTHHACLFNTRCAHACTSVCTKVRMAFTPFSNSLVPCFMVRVEFGNDMDRIQGNNFSNNQGWIWENSIKHYSVLVSDILVWKFCLDFETFASWVDHHGTFESIRDHVNKQFRCWTLIRTLIKVCLSISWRV